MLYLRYCKSCRCEIKTENRYATVILCEDCEKKKQEDKEKKKKNAVYIRKCLGCKCDVNVGNNGCVTFIYCQDCKNKKIEMKREENRRYMNKKFFRTCRFCGTKDEVNRSYRGSYTCLECKEKPNHIKKYIMKCKICNDDVIVDNSCKTLVNCKKCNELKKQYKIFKRDGISYRICIACKNEYKTNPKSRVYRCKDCKTEKSTTAKRICFARKKHYGYYGIASDGHRFWSLNEHDVEEWLIYNKIKHEPHKRIGNSMCHTDQYLPEFNLYIEVDGLRRKDDIDWKGKLSLYEKFGLKYKIIQPVNIHYYNDKSKCFRLLNEMFSFVVFADVVSKKKAVDLTEIQIGDNI